MPGRQSRAERAATPLARDSIRKIAESVGGCLRPVQLRRTGDGLFVANLRRAGQLRSGLSDEQAADAIWALSPDILWNQLVIQRGWTPDQFEMWYAGQLAAAILDDKQIPAVRQFSRKLITATTPTPAATAGRVSDV